MIAKKIFVLMLMQYSISMVQAQRTCDGSLTGEVADDSGQPVAGAFVLLLPINKSEVTDSLGNFRFSKLCDGKYHMEIQYLGFRTWELDLDIHGEQKQNVRLQQGTEQLAEVVIQDKVLNTEHAHNFTRLNESQLAASAGKSLGESIREIPGVNTIQAGPGIFKPVIHGVHSQRVLILNYGIRQEGQQWGAEHAPEIDPFVASDIVVIKDASAIKYGTDALGGVVVVNPPELPDRAGLSGTLSTVLQSNGRSGTMSGTLEGGIKDHDGWGWRIQGTAKRTGDFHTPDYVLTNTGIQELNFSGAAGYRHKSFGLEAFFSHFQTRIGILKGTSISSLDDLENAMERKEPQYTTSFSYRIGEPRQEVSHNLLKLDGRTDLGAGTLRFQYGFQNDNRKEFDIRKGGLSHLPAIDLQLNTHTLDADWEVKYSRAATLSIGLSSLAQQNNNIPGTQRIPFIPNFSSVSGGVFAITKINVDRWIFDLGARYDYRYYSVSGRDFKNVLYHANFDFHNASATAGATLQIDRAQTFSVSLSSAWRPPHVSELYSLGTHQSAAAIENGLLLNDSSEVMDIRDVFFKTEHALKAVTTYQHAWENFRLEMSPYVNYIFNYIYLRPTGITQNVRGVYPYFRYTQTNALFLGVDVSGTWSPDKHLKILPKASLLRASDETHHDYLIFIPSNRYDVAIRYEAPKLRQFFIESTVRYVARQNRAPRVVSVSEIKEANEQGIDLFENDKRNFDFMAPPRAYALWNLSAGLTLKGKKTNYDLRVSSENILNTAYREYTNRFRYYADELGRNFIVSLKCIF